MAHRAGRSGLRGAHRGIAGRFGSPAKTDPALKDDPPASSEPVVDIDTPDKSDAVVQIDGGTDNSQPDPAAGADSEGTEQTIQAAPVKPEAPENPTPVGDNHDSEDVPEAERNTEMPPTYTPEQTTVTTPSEPTPGSSNDNGQVYVPGFGYVDVGSGNQGGTLDDMYESGEKIGIMD